MGEMADDIIEGLVCSLCGIFFTGEHGYPVVCRTCWRNMSEDEREHHQMATLYEVGEI